MKAYLGAVYVNDFNMFNRVYRVYIQADQDFRTIGGDLNLFFARASNGTMVPLTSLGSIDYTTGPGNISRFNMYTSSSIQVTPAAGYSSGEAMAVIEQIVNERLPENIGLSWSGLSFQEQRAQGRTFLVLALVFLFAFLFLAALYESWSIPVAVILSFPIAVTTQVPIFCPMMESVVMFPTTCHIFLNFFLMLPFGCQSRLISDHCRLSGGDLRP